MTYVSSDHLAGPRFPTGGPIHPTRAAELFGPELPEERLGGDLRANIGDRLRANFAGLSALERSERAVKILEEIARHPGDTDGLIAIHVLCGLDRPVLSRAAIHSAAAYAEQPSHHRGMASQQFHDFAGIIDRVHAHDVLPSRPREEMTPDERVKAMQALLDRHMEISGSQHSPVNQLLVAAVEKLAGCDSLPVRMLSSQQFELLALAGRD